MADWNNPTTASNYSTSVLQVLKARDFDAISLCLADPTNMVDDMIKLVRSPVKFQRRSSGAWVDMLLDITGGGTGAATAGGARTALGLGTMATQDSSAVSISGGTLAGGGAGLTALTAANITSGGTLPALNGSNLTNLVATNLATGTVAPARLGSGSGGAVKFLREDSTWQTVALINSIQHGSITISAGLGANTYTCSPGVGANAVIMYNGHTFTSGTGQTGVRLSRVGNTITATRMDTTGDVVVNFDVIDFA